MTPSVRRVFSPLLLIAIFLLSCCLSGNAHAWGDEGHEIVGLIAEHYLKPKVKLTVDALLAGDTTHLTAGTDIASEATWADKYRDMDHRKLHYTQTRDWHFVDIEIQGGNLDEACSRHPLLPPDTLASQDTGPTCIVDKIEQFKAELTSPTTSENERRLALQFLLHFIGDLHQPLHASDDHDRGANSKEATASGIAKNNLHRYWDTEFVKKLGSDPRQVATQLIGNISTAQLARWSTGTTSAWALESNAVAKSKAYRPLPAPATDGSYSLSDRYVSTASKAVALQLSRTGVRLAMVLNQVID